jgi:hypothetical protein
MSKGIFYTDEEDKALLAVYEDASETDKKKKKYLDIVKKAQRYGICPGRTPDALSQHLSKLVNPVKEEETNDSAEASNWELETNHWKQKALSLEERNNEWLDVIFNSAWDVNDFGYLQWNYKEITRFTREKYPEKYSEAVERIKTMKGENIQ